MGFSAFTERKNKPNERQVRQVIGGKFPIWQGLILFLCEKYPVIANFKFLYGQDYGWGLRFSIKSQLLTSLYPNTESFFAQVNLSPEGVDRALRLPLGTNALQAIEGAHPYPEGRWVFIRVESEADAQDVRQLLALRVEERRLVR